VSRDQVSRSAVSETTSKNGEAGNLAGVELQRHRLAAHALDFGDDSLCVFAAALIGEDDIAAVTGDVESGVAAEPAAGAGNEGNLGHGQLLWCDHSDIAPASWAGCPKLDVPCLILQIHVRGRHLR
jgi:hypothetical protein